MHCFYLFLLFLCSLAFSFSFCYGVCLSAYSMAAAKRPSTWPPMTLAARSLSTMLRSLLLSLKTRPRSSPLLLLTALLSRPHLRSDCLRRRCPCAHISLTQLSCGPHPLSALQWLPGREMCSSPSMRAQSSPSRDWPTIVPGTSWSSLG